MLAASLLAATALSSGCTLIDSHDVALRDRELRVGDVVASDCPLLADARIRNATIAVVPTGRAHVRLTRTGLANLVHRRVPALALMHDADASLVTVRAPNEISWAHAAPCFAAAGPIADGDALTGADIAPTACAANNTSSPIRFDRVYGVATADGAIAAGAYLGHLSVPEHRRPNDGDALTVVTTSGPARIERQVVAAQPASRGHFLFVRDADGHVFAVPLSDVSHRDGAP